MVQFGLKGQTGALRAALLRVLMLLVIFCFGCQPLPEQPPGVLQREFAKSRLSAHQTRVMMNEFVVHFANRLEIRADEIFANTQEPHVRRNALLWKINGISACYQAASRKDPLGAYLDVWILTQQMIHYFESPHAEQQFGRWRNIALEESHSLDHRLREINKTVGGSARLGEDLVTQFASDYPITSMYFDREPIASRYIEEVKEPARELFHVVANLDDNLDELKKLSVLYAEHLPKQARWEAELFLMDATRLAIVREPLQNLSYVTNSVGTLTRIAESVPQLIERERYALNDLVTRERNAMLQNIEQMRTDTLEHFQGERALVLEAIQKEREVLLAELQRERISITQDLEKQLVQAVDRADQISRDRIADASLEAPAAIDYFFVRTWQTLGLLGIFAIPCIWWLRNRRGKTEAESEADVVPLRRAA